MILGLERFVALNERAKQTKSNIDKQALLEEYKGKLKLLKEG